MSRGDQLKTQLMFHPLPLKPSSFTFIAGKGCSYFAPLHEAVTKSLVTTSVTTET